MEQRDIELLLEYLNRILHDDAAASLDAAQLDSSAQELGRSLQAVQKKVNDLQEQVKQKAYHDSVTGIYNRIYFEEYLRQLLKEQREAVIVYMDLDGLKLVNDRFGHGEGDHYIRRFVTAVQEQFRATDVFARIGGDEFCLILPECTGELACARLEMVLEVLRESGNGGYLASFSYGLVVLTGIDAMTVDEILMAADAAMYEQKRKKKSGKADLKVQNDKAE